MNSLFESPAGELYAFGYVATRPNRRESAPPLVSADVEGYAPRIGRFDGRRFTWLLPDLPGAYPSYSARPFILWAQTGE